MRQGLVAFSVYMEQKSEFENGWLRSSIFIHFHAESSTRLHMSQHGWQIVDFKTSWKTFNIPFFLRIFKTVFLDLIDLNGLHIWYMWSIHIRIQICISSNAINHYIFIYCRCTRLMYDFLYVIPKISIDANPFMSSSSRILSCIFPVGPPRSYPIGLK